MKSVFTEIDGVEVELVCVEFENYQGDSYYKAEQMFIGKVDVSTWLDRLDMDDELHEIINE